MTDFSNTEENQICAHAFLDQSWTKDALFAALNTARAPEDAATNTEVAYPGYARQAVGPADTDWEPVDADYTAMRNVRTILFPASTGPGNVIATSFTLWNLVAGGVMRYTADLQSPVTIVGGGGGVSFDPGSIIIDFSTWRTPWLRQWVADQFLRSAVSPKFATPFLHLWTSTPDDRGQGGARLVGLGGDPLAIPMGSANWNDVVSGNGRILLKDPLKFGLPTATWPKITAISMESASDATGDFMDLIVIPAADQPTLSTNGERLAWGANSFFFEVA